ncbi:hypothetical protein AALB53_25310, partial [Lachnospiraceae bacterium 47-T17]
TDGFAPVFYDSERSAYVFRQTNRVKRIFRTTATISRGKDRRKGYHSCSDKGGRREDNVFDLSELQEFSRNRIELLEFEGDVLSENVYKYSLESGDIDFI